MSDIKQSPKNEFDAFESYFSRKLEDNRRAAVERGRYAICHMINTGIISNISKVCVERDAKRCVKITIEAVVDGRKKTVIEMPDGVEATNNLLTSALGVMNLSGTEL